MSFYSITKFSILSRFDLRFSNVAIYRANEKLHDDLIFAKKSYFRIKPIFILMGTLITKIAVFGAQKVHMWFYRSQCDRLFGTACGAEASLTHTNIYNYSQYGRLLHHDSQFFL